MCHLILLMPVIGLIVFWIWPFDTAMPVYLVILTISGLLYAAIMKSMRRPVTTGSEGLRGERVVVMEMRGHEGRVRLHGAIWRAVTDDDLRPSEPARVVAVNGLTLKIKREGAASTGL